MEWYYCILISAVYMFGIGCMWGYLCNTDSIVSVSAVVSILCCITWPVTMWPMLGSAVVERLYE